MMVLFWAGTEAKNLILGKTLSSSLQIAWIELKLLYTYIYIILLYVYILYYI